MSANPFDQQAAIPGIKHIVLVGSGKGGVGKSTVATNLALALKQMGRKVGLLDADFYGPSLPRMLGCLNQKPALNESQKMTPLVRYGLKLMSMGFLVDEGAALVWRGPMLFKAIEQFFRDVDWGELDELIIDLPPGTGDVALTIAQKVPVSAGITVSTPQNMSLIDAKRAVDMFERTNIPLAGVIENMSSYTPPGASEPIQLFPKGDLDQYLDSKGIKKLAEIPFLPTIGLCGESGIPIVEAEPDSEIAKTFQTLAKQLVSEIDDH